MCCEIVLISLESREGCISSCIRLFTGVFWDHFVHVFKSDNRPHNKDQWWQTKKMFINLTVWCEWCSILPNQGQTDVIKSNIHQQVILPWLVLVTWIQPLLCLSPQLCCFLSYLWKRWPAFVSLLPFQTPLSDTILTKCSTNTSGSLLSSPLLLPLTRVGLDDNSSLIPFWNT